MPSLEDPSVQRWQLAFTNALQRRIEVEQLKAPLKELMRKNGLSGEAIARVLLGLRAEKPGFDDPLLFKYVRLLLSEDYVGTGDLLLVLLSSSKSTPDSAQMKGRASGLPSCEERIFLLLAELHHTGSLPIDRAQIHRTTHAVTRWLHTMYDREYNAQLETAGAHSLDTSAYGTYEALASLAISIFGQQSFRAVGDHAWWKTRRAAVVREMRNYDVHVLQWMQSQWTGRLQALTTLPPFVEMGEDGRPLLNHDQVMMALAQDGTIPAAQSRAGLYVWLNTCLCGRPATDDMNMLGYLQTRYNGDNQTLVVQLLHASFDVLTGALLRGQPAHDVKVIRSFICNKVPLLLATLGSFMGSVMLETCIQTAFLSIAMDPIPPISAGSLEATEMLKRTRLEFLQACALHSVTSENTIGLILQEPPLGMPKLTKYTKQGLLSQCTANIGRLEALTTELQGMQGNAGAVCLCIVELIGGLCASRDTMSLKTACNILIKHIRNMDIVMQYTRPDTLLLPLCMLLKDWVHDQDQSEFTPAYEEFASVLLFTLAVVHRYGLTSEDLGVAGMGNIVFDILGETPRGTSLSDLSPEQNQQLAKWLDGLFATDDQGETSGISDEVMRQCPPQAFYMLVPTLFEQSVMACKSGHLSLGTLKSGLELLLEPFLLPSLVGGLGWLVSHSWEDHNDVDILLQILDKLLRPSSSSTETQAMHRAVLAMIAEPLERSLQDLLRKRPDKTVAQGMTALLRKYAGATRTCSSDRATVTEWVASGDIARELRSSVKDMTSWAANVTPTPPPRYQPRILPAACELLGIRSVVEALSTAMREMPLPLTAIVLDVCTSMVCAPSLVSHALRQQLALAASNTQTLLEKSVGEATALVRLQHSVEAQLVVHQLQMPLAVPPQQSTDQMMADLGLASEAAAAADVALIDSTIPALQMTDAEIDAALEQPMQLADTTAQGMPIVNSGDMQSGQVQDFFDELGMPMDQQVMPLQQMLPQSSALSMSDPNADEDIFAGLDMTGGDMGEMEDDFNFG
ncbi:hypothetical protein LTR81_016551 [Elasticomyces elasticus]